MMYHEIQNAIVYLKENNVLCPAGIPAEIFKIVNQEMTDIIHNICNSIQDCGIQLKDWFNNTLNPTEKGLSQRCENYHTISLILYAVNWYSRQTIQTDNTTIAEFVKGTQRNLEQILNLRIMIEQKLMNTMYPSFYVSQKSVHCAMFEALGNFEEVVNSYALSMANTTTI